MADTSFRPVVYLKEKCPFCLKVRIFLLEAGLAGSVDVREFTPDTPQEETLKAELKPHFEKVTFPSAQVAPGRYINDSDGIIGHFAQQAQVDPAQMPVLSSYVGGAFQQMMNLFRENMELKKQVQA